MTHLAHSPVVHRDGLRTSIGRLSWPALLYAVVALGAAGGFALGAVSTEAATYDGHLAILLRFMAVVKMAAMIGATGLAHWRVRGLLPATTALGYIGAVGLMALAPGLIWSLHHLVVGAACFHAGLLVFLVVALRDDPVSRALQSRRR